MSYRRLLGRLLSYFVLVVAMVHVANAGGFQGRRDSVEFTGNSNRMFAPRSDIEIAFNADEYSYGSGDYAYMVVAVVPASERFARVTTEQLDRWLIYGVLMRNPEHLMSLEQAAMRLKLKFRAPEAPGKYQVLVHQIYMFRRNPLKSTGELKQIFVPHILDRRELVKAAASYPSSFQQIATFTVAQEMPIVNERLSVSLLVNGKVPIPPKVLGGIVERPLNFSWRVGDEFKRDRRRVVFRYQISPEDEDWGAWSEQTEVPYFFLPKGVHQFRVQAKFVDGPTVIESGVASFQFTLDKDLVAKPSKEALKAPFGVVPALQPKIAFKEVYAKSRALLIGIWEFEDALNFPQFDGQKIGQDLAAMKAALELNEFDVTVLNSGRVKREEIAEELTKLVERSGENDRLFVYFSTHGFSDPLLPVDGYLATTDCMKNKPSSRCMRLNDLETHADRALTGKKVRQVLFAVDSCFAGLGIVRKSANAPDLTQLAVPKGAFMLTAGMAHQFAQIDSQLGMSTFTYFLSEGLTGKAQILGNNGVITLTELSLYVQYEVARHTNSQQIPMLGRMRGDGEMLFAPLGAKDEKLSTVTR